MKKSNSSQFNEKTGMDRCLENEIAFCTVRCPFHLDVPEFINKIQRGSFTTAFNDFRNAVGFPRIALHLCHEPCKDVCPRKDSDDALQLKFLEKATLAFSDERKPQVYNLPTKNKSIAIIGAGLCGMACALLLCRKKYQIDIFEKTNQIGGHLWDIMEAPIFLEDFEEQLLYEQYTLHLNSEIQSLESITSQYDAVLVATGVNGVAAKGAGIFNGGALLGKNDLEALIDGLKLAKQIEAYLKTGVVSSSIDYTGGTHIPYPNMKTIPLLPTKMACPDGFSEAEARREAERCLRCKCDSCRKECDLLLHFKKTPMKAMEEIRATTEVRGVLTENMTIATKMIASCNQCGLCEESCPEHINFQSVILEARRVLHRKGALPWAFNDFFLRDMAHANTEADIIINPVKTDTPKYIFFPGCQLGASDPRYVMESYKLLLKHYPDTVLIQRCCGAPAVWSGDEPLQNQVFNKFRIHWVEYGKPDIIFACPTCKKIFNEYLPEVQGQSLYEHFIKLDTNGQQYSSKVIASVFDSCNARHDRGVQKAVRRLAQASGYELVPLQSEGELAKCCGFGGNSSIVNPEKTNSTVDRRITQNQELYIAYCVNCRDIFADYGKPAIHILDVIFHLNDQFRPAPSITERRRNREKVKFELMRKYCDLELEKSTIQPTNIFISDLLKQKLNKNHILEDDIYTVINYCETNSIKVKNTKENLFFGHRKIGHTTFWIEYKYMDEAIELVNAYTHRISIKE